MLPHKYQKIGNSPDAVSIMVIAAHPDDLESWCAGTLALALARGATVRLLLVTSGDKGSSNRQDDVDVVAKRREEEARQAAEILGIAHVEFLRQPDGEVENTNQLREQLVRWIRRWKPAIVFTHDPEHPLPPYLSHRDHRIVGRATLDAAYPLARDHLSFVKHWHEESLEPHAVQQVWLFASDNINQLTYIDINMSFEAKIKARLAHKSQTIDPQMLKENWRKRAASVGEQAGLALAEAFTILEL